MSNVDERWRPEVCPLTGRPFFAWVSHHATGKPVPLYGGPSGGYTIPVCTEDGAYQCECYDPEQGGWQTGEMVDAGVRVIDNNLFPWAKDPSEFMAELRQLLDELIGMSAESRPACRYLLKIKGAIPLMVRLGLPDTFEDEGRAEQVAGALRDEHGVEVKVVPLISTLARPDLLSIG